MKIVRFGYTDIYVSEIGLGLAALGRPGYINLGHGDDLNFDYDPDAMQLQTQKVLECAYSLGIRYFDVARSYGRGEEFLSQWIQSNQDKKDFVIGSKWGYTYTAGWKVQAEKHEVKNHSKEVLDRQWPESKSLLGSRLALYHIHSATSDSGVLDNSEVLEGLWKLKESGIAVGLSLSGEKQSETLEKAFTLKSGDQYLFSSVQATWNLLEQSATSVLRYASQIGWGVIVKEALANGRLTDRNEEIAFREKKNILKEIAEKYDIGVDALCMAVVLSEAWSSTVLSGATTVEQLQSNVKAADLRLSPGDLLMLKELAESPDTYWSKRSALQWN